MSALTSRLLAGQRVDKTGAFTVDGEKAKTKLERFRLADPLFYTVELVQAAVLSGATRIEIDVDNDDFALRFQAAHPYGAADLSDLQSAVLVRGDNTHPARLQLALAVTAALAQRPRRLVVVGDGATLIHERDVTRVVPSEPTTTMSIAMRERFRLGHLGELLTGLIKMTPEERLVRERCRFAAVDVVVNGALISKAPWPGSPHVELAVKDTRGVVGFLADPHAPSRIFLLRAGVLQEELEWATVAPTVPPTGVFAVVDGATLDRDASFTKFVRNKAFQAHVDAVVRALIQTPALLGADLQRGDQLAVARARMIAHWAGPRVFEDAFKPIAEGPLFRDIQARPLSIKVLRSERSRRGAVLVRRSLGPVDPALLKDDVVVQSTGASDEALLKAIGISTGDGDAHVERLVEQRGRYTDFRRRQAPAQLMGVDRFRVAEHEGVSIEVGLRHSGPHNAVIQVVVDNCLLCSLTKAVPIPRLSILLRGPFTPNRTYDGVVADESFADALAQAVRLIPDLLDGPYPRSELSDVGMRDALTPLLGLILDGEMLWKAFADALSLNAALRQRGPWPALPSTGSRAHGALSFPLLAVFPEGSTSIDALRDSNAPLGVVPLSTPPFAHALHTAVIADEVMRRVLKATIPTRPLVSLDDQAQQAQRRARLMRRNTSPARIEGLLVRVPLMTTRLEVGASRDRRRPESALSGFVGVVAGAAEPGTRLRLSCRERLVQDVVIDGPCSGLVAVVDDPDIELNDDLRADDVSHVMACVSATIPTLMKEVVSAGSPVAWRMAAQLVGLAFPTDVATDAWQLLAARTGSKAGWIWQQVLQRAATLEPPQGEPAFRALVTQWSSPPLASRTLSADLLPVPHTEARAQRAHTAFIDAALEHPDGVLRGLLEGYGLGALTCWTLGGDAITLASLVERKVVRVARPGSAPVDGFEDVVIALPDARAVLRRLGCVIEAIDDELATARAKRAFADRPRRAVALPPELVTIAHVDIDDKETQGVVALLPGPPAQFPSSLLEVLYQGRPLCRLDLGDQLGIKACAIIDSTAITPNADFTGLVHDDKRAALLARITDAVTQLCLSLADCPPSDRPAGARARLLEYMLPTRKRVSEARAVDRLRRSSLFVSVSGAPVDLTRPTKKKPLPILTSALPGLPAAYTDAVVVEDPAERELLGKLVPTVVVDSSWHAAVREQAQRARLGPLPAPHEVAALHRRVTRVGRSRLTLVIPEDLSLAIRLAVGHEGLLVEEVRSKGLPCVGVLEGESVVQNWQRARVSDDLWGAIRREVVTLWKAALTSWRDDKTLDSAHREALRRTFVNLTAVLMKADAGEHTLDELALRSALRALPLLPLATGGFVSIDRAAQTADEEHRSFLIAVGALKASMLTTSSTVAPVPTPTTKAATKPPRNKKKTAKATPTAPARPQPPPDSQVVNLHERLHAEFRLLRRQTTTLLSNTEIERIHVKRLGDRALINRHNGFVVVNVDHPIAQAAQSDPAALVLLASAAASALNVALDSFTDDEERALIVAMARHARTLDQSPRLDDTSSA